MATHQKEIYLVEDSADFRQLVRGIFNKFLPDYAIRFFQGGNELYHYMILQSSSDYTGRRPGLVIMDLDLPSINGYEMIKLLRKSPSNSVTAWNSLPIVVLSNSGSQEEIKRCYRAGANSFFVKPIDFEDLHIMLETICKYWIGYNQLATPDTALDLTSEPGEN